MPRPLPAHVLALTGGDPDAVGNHILDAARRVIASKGLAGASTRAIADEAGVSSGTLYNYFGGHVQLLAKAIVLRAKDVADRSPASPRAPARPPSRRTCGCSSGTRPPSSMS